MDSLLILALDIGTSSSRAALFDSGANRIEGATVQKTYPVLTSATGAAEIDPATLLAAVRECIAGTLQVYRSNPKLRGRKIAGIGVSCFWHSLIGCDASGRPLTNIITWADSRCRGDAAHLRETLSEKRIHAQTGCMLRASFWPAKLTWLRRTQKAVFARVAQWMSPAEWLQLQLVGDANCAIGMATGTGFLDPVRVKWNSGLMDGCGLAPGRVRPLSDEPSVVGAVAGLEELRGVPWYPAIGDGAASNLGSGATREGLAAINVGTSAALRVMRKGKNARAPFGLFCYRVDAERYLVGGAVSNAGNLRAWCLKELQVPDDATIERELAARPGPGHGLTVLPFWTAERAPSWNEDDRGAIHGLSQHTTAMDLLQAITEATYHRIALIAGLVVKAEARAPKFIVSGGIQRSASSLQRLADVLGHPVHPNDEMEASIRGAAIYVLEKLGRSIGAGSVGRAVKPRAKWAKAYLSERERQGAMEAALSKV